MTSTRNMLLAGAVGAFLAGSAAAVAALLPLHEMTVQLPGGGTAKISYAGRAPQVAIYPNAVNARIRPAALEIPGFAAAPLNPIAVMMEHNMATLQNAALGVCIRQFEITSNNDGQPIVVTHMSGNCGAAPSAPGETRQHI